MGTQLQRDVYNDFQRQFKPQTNFTPQTNFAPTLSAPKNLTSTAPASPAANVQEDPGAEQRKKLIKQSTGASPHLPFEEDMRGAAAKFGVPYEALYGILNQESSFNPNAVNNEVNPKTGKPSGATGIGQFIPSTAAKFNIDPRDPKASIYATAQYLRENTDYHQGDMRLGIASHYTGPGNANSPEGFKYVDMVSKKMPGNGLETYGPRTATPGSSAGVRQPSLTGMDQDKLQELNAALPESRRSIQTIRGNTEGWFNPQQAREFATLGESMRGQPGEPTYESALKERLVKDKLTSDENVQRIKNEGDMNQLNRAAELAKEEKPKSAADALKDIEGGGSSGTVATPGRAASDGAPRPYIPEEERAALESITENLRRKQKEEEEYRLSLLGGQDGFVEDYGF